MAKTFEYPDKIGRISDSVANKAVTRNLLDGGPLPIEMLVRGSTETTDESPRWEAAELRGLLEEAMSRFRDDKPSASDAWLAPRLHYTLRLTRAEAVDTTLWNFIALRVAPDFVRWRWGKVKDGRLVVSQAARFSGPWYKQSFSLLWWAAEIFRDGEDYRPVESACRNQDVLNTALRLNICHHRPTAQAMVELIEDGTIRTGRELNGLVRAVTTADSTLVYERLGPDQPRDHSIHQEWVETGHLDSVYDPERIPTGPMDGSVPYRSVEELSKLYKELFKGAHVRGKKN
ncbi:DUF6339 family protein [Streptomyces sp. HUAS MG91]|uniref:DUF6339 family protein n=1 Tax=Streptomyces tabacisoli TaxID=3156398 RepID=A0AAU8IS31_9ACTN